VKDDFAPFMADPETLISNVFDPARWKPWAPDDEEAVKNDFDVVLELSLGLLEETLGSAEERLQNVARKLRSHIACRDTDTAAQGKPDLTIATLWSAKGVTADHVYVLGLCHEAIPGTKREDYPGTVKEHFEEQQRLFYVTVTRSKGTLVLSRALRVKRGDASKLGLGVHGTAYYADLRISTFLTSLLSKLPTPVAGEDWAGCT
jgi:superfamily I DNA/RNA helicase